MQSRMHIALSVVAVATAAAGSWGTPASPAGPLTRCVESSRWPAFRGEYYQQYTLRHTQVRVGAPIGTAFYRRTYVFGCVPVNLGVYRISGVAPRVAVSVEVDVSTRESARARGSRRRLLIRPGLCVPVGQRFARSAALERRLLRCLRRESVTQA